MQLWVILNKSSGHSDAAQAREALAEVFREEKCTANFVPVPPGGLIAACDAAARAAAAAHGVLVAVGGDGTLNAAAQAALAHGCRMGVIPQGTFNYFGRGNGIPQDARAAARALVRGREAPVQVGRVNGHVFLVNASLGLYPQLLEDRETFKQQLGRRRWVAILSGLWTLFEWRRQLTLDIEQDGRTTTVRTPTLFVGNSRLQLDRVGIDPAVAACVGAGCLGAVAVAPTRGGALLGLALRGALGRLGEAEEVRSFSCMRLTVRPWRVRRVKVATDGEVRYMAVPLRFEVSPEPLRLMLPAEEDRVAVE
jgi:diacylglycerol kinase family enzyme